MSKEQIVSDAKAALLAGQDAILTQVLGVVADQSALEQKASDGTLSQADVDAAVLAAVTPLNDQIAALQLQDAADIKAGQDALASLQATLDTLAQKEGIEASVIAGLQGSLSVLQDVVAKLSGLLPQPST